jgi:enamine deaminase RidA (YjgF/YER057c/UK114 family)
MVSIDEKLSNLGLTLPAPPKPVASYVPAVLAGDLLYLSGILPFRDGQVAITGKLGAGCDGRSGEPKRRGWRC